MVCLVLVHMIDFLKSNFIKSEVVRWINKMSEISLPNIVSIVHVHLTLKFET